MFMIRDHEIGPVRWSENLQFPFCDYCLRGKTCECEAKDQELCDYCENDKECQCGYEEGQRYGYGECTCECNCDDLSEEARDEGEECEYCEEGCTCGADDYPDSCQCECECEYRCKCRCQCKTLVIDHHSFNQWVKETCYVGSPECFDDNYLLYVEQDSEGNLIKVPTNEQALEGRCITKAGPYEFAIRTIPEIIRKRVPIRSMQEMFGMPSFLSSEERKYEIKDQYTVLQILQNNMKGFIRFDGPIHLAGLYQYPSYGNGPPTTWMSLTPMEVMSQKPGVDLAYGNVLIGGLGMGWMTQRVLQKPKVSSITQVELDPAIIGFFGIPLTQMPGGQRLRLVEANFWDFVEATDISQFDTILVDVWPKAADARRDRKFMQLKKSHPNVWGWGIHANWLPEKPKEKSKFSKKKRLSKKKKKKRPR